MDMLYPPSPLSTWGSWVHGGGLHSSTAGSQAPAPQEAHLLSWQP